MDHFFDLFHGEKLPGHFHGSIHHQGRDHQDSRTGDRFDILDLDHFRFKIQFLHRFFGPLRELVAFASTHSQHFDLLHLLLLDKSSERKGVGGLSVFIHAQKKFRVLSSEFGVKGDKAPVLDFRHFEF